MYDNEVKYLKMVELREGGTYRIIARNADIGIWMLRIRGFLILRTKFSDTFLFVEYHWDTGEPHGTVKPLAFIEDSPFQLSVLYDVIEKECSTPTRLAIHKYLEIHKNTCIKEVEDE